MLRTIAHRKKELLSEGVFELIIMRHLDPTPPLDLQLHEVVDFLTFTPGFGSEESVTRVGKQCRVEYTKWLQVTAPNPGHLGSFPASTLWSLCGLGKITQPLSASVSALRRNNNNRYYLIKFQRG